MERWISVLVLFATAMVGCATPYRGVHVALAGAQQERGDYHRLRFVVTSASPPHVGKSAEQIADDIRWSVLSKESDTVFGWGMQHGFPVKVWPHHPRRTSPSARDDLEIRRRVRIDVGRVVVTDTGAEAHVPIFLKAPISTVCIRPKFAGKLRSRYPGIEVSSVPGPVIAAVSTDAAAPASSEPAPAR
jgi:hypothetical protein